MEFSDEECNFIRERANTLEKSEQIRPPIRRKRRSSHDLTSNMRPREIRSGSVPPNGLLTSIQGTSDPPQPLPRLRRSAGRPKLSRPTTAPASQPCSGHNTPLSEIEGSSALDLSDLTPFGRSQATSSSQRHPKTSKHKWNWIWSKSGKENSHDSQHQNNHHAGMKYSGSFLSRKRKSRHISCPDITAASCDSSRSTSPVSFKVSLTSLFGTNGPHHKHSFTGSLSRHQRKEATASIAAAVKTTNLALTHPIISQPRFLSDTATEVVQDLRPIQYCHVTQPDDWLSQLPTSGYLSWRAREARDTVVF